MMKLSLAGKSSLVLIIAGLLAACGAVARTTPSPLPTVVLGGNHAATAASPAAGGSAVTASGRVVPAQQAELAFSMAGRIEELDLSVGERVEAGQVLSRLAGREQLKAALSGAELEVLAAEQALQELTDNLPEDQAAALQEVHDARQALREAERKVAGLGVPSEPIDIEVARSNVALAKRALDQAKKDFKPYENKPENNLIRAALLSKLSDAQKRYEDALKQLNRLSGVIVPEFDLQQAQTELEIAQAKLKIAEDRYSLLQNGPVPEEVSLAQARLANAQDQADAARASLANLELIAPFAGTVSAIDLHRGEWVIPGRPVLVLADLDRLRVETTDLSERDVPMVEIGQDAIILIKALNQEVTGLVSEIAPLAETLGGDVVYRATLDLDYLPTGLRPGMSVEVQFGTGAD